ncbi:hypothetical protein [Haliangium sp.]|uniref:hypothetical protein n=1 Tax=Haliangium sp. TaxID=2663208 RepID=UPI003D0F03DE
MTSRVYAYVVSLGVLFAVSLPFTWPLHRDSFPLSNYPMFSRPLPEPVVTLQYAVGLEPDGTRHYVSPRLVANEEVLQARAVIAGAVYRGADATAALCRSIAGRVAAAGGEWAAVTEVQVISGSHDAVALLTDKPAGSDETVYGRCRVEREP